MRCATPSYHFRVRSGDLDADGTLDPGGDMSMRLRMGGIHTWRAPGRERPFELLDELRGGHAGPHCRAALTGQWFPHFERRRIVAVSARPILPKTRSTSITVMSSRSICCRSCEALPTESPGSAEACGADAFVQGWQNSPPRRRNGNAVSASNRRPRQWWPAAAPAHDRARAIGTHQPAIEWIPVFAWDPAADEVPPQHGHQRDGETRGGCHRIGLGVCHRRKQASLLRLERKNRDERQRDDEQAEEGARAPPARLPRR